MILRWLRNDCFSLWLPYGPSLSPIWSIPKWHIELPDIVYTPAFWYFCLPMVLNRLHHWEIFLAGNLTGKNDISIISCLSSNEHPLPAYKLSLYGCFIVPYFWFNQQNGATYGGKGSTYVFKRLRKTWNLASQSKMFTWLMFIPFSFILRRGSAEAAICPSNGFKKKSGVIFPMLVTGFFFSLDFS